MPYKNTICILYLTKCGCNRLPRSGIVVSDRGAKWGEHVWVFVMQDMGKSTSNARVYRKAGALAP